MEPITLPTADGPRRYHLTRPAGPVRGVLLFLPGTGGTAAWAARDTHFPEAAVAAGFAAAVPDGLPPDPARPAKFLTNPPRWNDGGTRPGDPLHSAADDVGFLAAVTSDLTARGLAPTGRVRITGFSNGAGMAFRFAAERADLVSALAPVAGYHWLAAARPTHPVPTLYLVGDADPLVPLAGGWVRLPWGGQPVPRPAVADTLAGWAEALGCRVTPDPAIDIEGVRAVVYPGPVPFRAVIIAGHGHHWPGGEGIMGEQTGGPRSAAFDATARVVAWLAASLGERGASAP